MKKGKRINNIQNGKEKKEGNEISDCIVLGINEK